jgi:hypothetical protein
VSSSRAGVTWNEWPAGAVAVQDVFPGEVSAGEHAVSASASHADHWKQSLGPGVNPVNAGTSHSSALPPTPVHSAMLGRPRRKRDDPARPFWLASTPRAMALGGEASLARASQTAADARKRRWRLGVNDIDRPRGEPGMSLPGVGVAGETDYQGMEAKALCDAC